MGSSFLSQLAIVSKILPFENYLRPFYFFLSSRKWLFQDHPQKRSPSAWVGECTIHVLPLIIVTCFFTNLMSKCGSKPVSYPSPPKSMCPVGFIGNVEKNQGPLKNKKQNYFLCYCDCVGKIRNRTKVF